MKHLSWIILFPLAVLLIVFSVTNRDAIAIDLWPFPLMIDVPLFAVVFAALLVGVLWGGVSAWLNGGKTRRTARLKSREAEMTASENRRLKDRIATLEADARAAETDRSRTATDATNNPRGLPPPADGA